jgi:hypothetical protein
VQVLNLASPFPIPILLISAVERGTMLSPRLDRRSAFDCPLHSQSQKTSTEVSDRFGRVTSRSSARGAATAPPKKDRNGNVEKTRIRTLSAAKGRAPGPMLRARHPRRQRRPCKPVRTRTRSVPISFSLVSPSHLPDALWRPGTISRFYVFWRSPMPCADATVACRLLWPSSGQVLSNPRYSCRQ